jgi:hypothetical protein
MAATLQYLGPLPDTLKHTLADRAFQSLGEVLRSVPPTFTLPCPPLASNTAATPTGSSTSGRQAQVQVRQPRRGKARQRTARGGQQQQQHRQGSQAPDVGPSSSSAQQLSAQDERVQALDTLGLMLGCTTALQRTLPLLSPAGPDLGEIKASSRLSGCSGPLLGTLNCFGVLLLVTTTLVQHAHRALCRHTSCRHSPAHRHADQQVLFSLCCLTVPGTSSLVTALPHPCLQKHHATESSPGQDDLHFTAPLSKSAAVCHATSQTHCPASTGILCLLQQAQLQHGPIQAGKEAGGAAAAGPAAGAWAVTAAPPLGQQRP